MPEVYGYIVTKWLTRKSLRKWREWVAETGDKWVITKCLKGSKAGLYRLRREGGRSPLNRQEELIVEEGGGDVDGGADQIKTQRTWG